MAPPGHFFLVRAFLSPGKGRQKKNRKKTANVRTYFIWPGICLDAHTTSWFFLSHFFVFLVPFSRNGQKRNKNIDKGKNLDARPRKTFFITFF